MKIANSWLLAASLVSVSAILAGCDDDNGVPDTSANPKNLSGVVQSVLNGAPQANRAFVVNDLSKAPADEKVAEGVSDSNGQFTISLKGRTFYIVFPPVSGAGEPRSSGLASLADGDASKTLKNDTDIACVAGVTAVRSGAITADLLTAARIANLEAAARKILAGRTVNFNSAEDVGAAAAEARQMTNDGANPPPA